MIEWLFCISLQYVKTTTFCIVDRELLVRRGKSLNRNSIYLLSVAEPEWDSSLDTAVRVWSSAWDPISRSISVRRYIRSLFNLLNSE
jgi:hypothetical protein